MLILILFILISASPGMKLKTECSMDPYAMGDRKPPYPGLAPPITAAGYPNGYYDAKTCAM